MSNVHPENSVSLFPTVACRDAEDAGWKVLVQGDVFTIGHIGLTKKLLLRFLQRMLRASDAALRSEIFQGRIERFLARDERGKTVTVRLGDSLFVVPGKTGPTGHFSGLIQVPDHLLSAPLENSVPTDLPVRTQLQIEFPAEDNRIVAGEAFLLPQQGLSVISDIDDTVKHSQVGCRRTLLQNTFLNPFEVVDQMATIYQQWAGQGAAFHYVSSSPWHLYHPLAALLAVENFPAGSFHLRSFRLRDHFVRRLLLMRRSGKSVIITSLVRMFPQRQFILVGDSGEHDPEIYGAIARRFPQQIMKTFIRDLAGPKSSQRRYQRAFRQIPPEKWQLFRRAEELPKLEGENLRTNS